MEIKHREQQSSNKSQKICRNAMIAFMKIGGIELMVNINVKSVEKP